MADIQQIEVEGVTYNVAHAPALKQKTLMLLLGGKIAMNSARGGVEEIDVDLLVGSLMTLPEDTFDKVASITLAKVFKSGDDVPVNVGDFQGSILSYFKLVAESVKVNLNDFFTYLDDVNRLNRPKRPTLNQ